MLIAIVGSRDCTSAEFDMAYKLGLNLARSGHVVISGLARGIDTAALTGASDAGRPSIAILPTAPTEAIYPRSNSGLGERIKSSGGVLVAPFPSPCNEPWLLRRRLIERNFLMAQWCDAAVVVADSPFINGGTGWMVSFCQQLGRPLYRLDTQGYFHLSNLELKRRVTWQPELKAISTARLSLE